MKISVFNGSPRGVKSNSARILDWVIEGIGQDLDKYLIRNISNHKEYLEKASDSDLFIMAFPLYTDGMPAIVMKFFEEMARESEKIKGKKILYIIHSGFPEGCQSVPLKNYLIRFTGKLEMELYDVIIKSGSEAYRAMPDEALKKQRAMFVEIGKSAAAGNPIHEKISAKLMSPYKFSGFSIIVVKIMKKMGLIDMYFKKQIKENGVLDKSRDMPYIEN